MKLEKKIGWQQGERGDVKCFLVDLDEVHFMCGTFDCSKCVKCITICIHKKEMIAHLPLLM